jgi:cold shock CspA family protein
MLPLTSQNLHQELKTRVAEAIKAYEDSYEAERAYYAEHLPGHEIPDFRKRNAGLNPANAQLFYAPEATHENVYFHYEDVFASIPWRGIVPFVVYKETPKLLMVGWDSDLESLNHRSRVEFADPGDSIDLDELHISTSVQYAFKQIPKSELGKRIFRTAQEAFDSLPTEHKLPRVEMERKVAEAKLERNARLNGEDEERRSQPCARCRQPIGRRDYIRHLGGLTHDKTRQYIHKDCRKCEICGELITGEYVTVDIHQDTQKQQSGNVRVFSMFSFQDRHYFHAACAYHAGIKPHSGGALNAEYGFHTHDTKHEGEVR